MIDLPAGIRRVTLPLPMRPGHVHAYLLPGEDGWTVVDTGLGLPDATVRWMAELGDLRNRVARIFVTHFHPDHVGAAADLAELTGAPVIQGRTDFEQCRLAWASEGWAAELTAWFRRHGAPPHVTGELIEQGSAYRPLVRFAPDPVLVEHGDTVGGWQVIAAPGHADGQLTLARDGILVAADHLLPRITPTVGLWPRSRPDPLGDFQRALEATIALAPDIALPGHGEPLHDPATRARELLEHHRERLDTSAAALSGGPMSGYDASFHLFGAELNPQGRRFAVAETLSHLERLVLDERALRHEHLGIVSYTAR